MLGTFGKTAGTLLSLHGVYGLPGPEVRGCRAPQQESAAGLGRAWGANRRCRRTDRETRALYALPPSSIPQESLGRNAPYHLIIKELLEPCRIRVRELKGFVKGIKTDFVREGDRL
jgi:hypothetical protein